MRVEKGIREAMRVSGGLIGQRHQTGEEWAREASARDAIFIVVHAVRKRLRLSDKHSSLRIANRRNIRNAASRKMQSGSDLVGRFCKEPAYAAS